MGPDKPLPPPPPMTHDTSPVTPKATGAHPPLPPPRPLLQAPVPFQAFEHPLIESFALVLHCRRPLTSVVTTADLRLQYLDLLGDMALNLRLQHYQMSEWDLPAVGLSNSQGYEINMGLVRLALGGRPSQWEAAIRLGIRELKRWYTHGVSRAELDFLLGALGAPPLSRRAPKAAGVGPSPCPALGLWSCAPLQLPGGGKDIPPSPPMPMDHGPPPQIFSPNCT